VHVEQGWNQYNTSYSTAQSGEVSGPKSGRRDGRNGRFVNGPREKWKPNLKIIKAVIQFVMKTGRFQPKATIAEDIGVVEEAGVVEGAGVAEETEQPQTGLRPAESLTRNKWQTLD
jgi:hypothetical protein